MHYALELKQINKRYKNHIVLNDLNMRVPCGDVYGFLGRNGAGKTTTIRIIMGLVKPGSGSVCILDSDMRANRASAMRSIGAIVEKPAFYPNLSGMDNLRVTADLFGTDHKHIGEVLRIVDMEKYAGHKVKTYSTGMKKRLGIANALVHSPEILILDEPTNGLDPNGVKDLRVLIRSLSNEMDITVLVSSHILTEIEQVADSVGILHQGRIADQFNIRELNNREQKALLLKVEQPEKAEALLKEKGFEYRISGRQIKLQCPRAQNAGINILLTSRGIAILNMSSVTDSLEDRFFSVVDVDPSNAEAQ